LLSGILTVSHRTEFNPTGKEQTLHQVNFKDGDLDDKMRLLRQAETAAAFKEKLSKQ